MLIYCTTVVEQRHTTRMKICGSVVSLSFIFPHPPEDRKKKKKTHTHTRFEV